jgi:uncharacterized protein YciI
LLFALVAYDRPNHVALRMEIRPTHLKFLDDLGDTVKFAGPFLNDANEGIGSFVVIEAASLDDARAVFARDPYAIAGLFDSITVKPWRLLIDKLK